ANKLERGFRFTFTKRVGCNQFVLGDSKKGPLVAVIGMLIGTDRALLLLNERPGLINLNQTCASVSQLAIKNAFGFLASDTQDFKSGFRVDPIEPSGCSDSAAFGHAR